MKLNLCQKIWGNLKFSQTESELESEFETVSGTKSESEFESELQEQKLCQKPDTTLIKIRKK